MTAPLALHERHYKPIVINCAFCGRRRAAERPNARFCSDACRKRAARAVHDDRVCCAVCVVRRPPAEFGRFKACRACRSALARLRRAARVAGFRACKVCRVAKPPGEFYANHSSCKACSRAIARLRRARGAVPPNQFI
jgi:hypothetical protein